VLIAAPTDADRSAIMDQRAHLPKERSEMPPFNNGPRTSLMEVRPRMLLMVEEHGHTEVGYDRTALGDHFMTHWHRLFGSLRKNKASEVESDKLRKEVMISRLLNLIETRQAEYAEERAGLKRTSNNSNVTIYHKSKQTLRAEYRARAEAVAASHGFKPNYIDKI
jgi:hypothetical protein